MVTPHEILCINGAWAGKLISRIPFMGPVGAIRFGIVDGELAVNPTLQEAAETDLDLIVVGTSEGLTMVEAGAAEVPEDRLLEALDLAHSEIKKLCAAQEELRSQAGKPKWLDRGLTEELERDQGHVIWERIQQVGLREASAAVDELMEDLCPQLTMSSTEDDIVRRTQVRSALTMLLDKQRLVAVEGPLREQFEDELKALTDAEQDSKELKSAKRHLLFDRITETLELPFPAGPAPAEGEPGQDTTTKQFVKRAAEAVYKDLVRKKIAVDKRRPDGRAAEEIRAISCEVGVSPRTH